MPDSMGPVTRSVEGSGAADAATHIADTSAAHAAASISANSATLVGTGTDVQAVFEELDNAIVATETVANNAVTKNGGGKETVDLHGSAAVGAAETIDLANGNIHRLILDENLTITLTGTTASVGCSVTVILVQDAGAGNTVTWPVAVKWAGGVAPVITATANAVDVITLLTADNGTTWYGFRAGAAMA